MSENTLSSSHTPRKLPWVNYSVHSTAWNNHTPYMYVTDARTFSKSRYHQPPQAIIRSVNTEYSVFYSKGFCQTYTLNIVSVSLFVNTVYTVCCSTVENYAIKVYNKGNSYVESISAPVSSLMQYSSKICRQPTHIWWCTGLPAPWKENTFSSQTFIIVFFFSSVQKALELECCFIRSGWCSNGS